MSSEEEADNNLQKFFLPIEWSEMSALEKSRAQNIFDNYQTMKTMGLQPQEPYFIKDYKKREEENVARIARLKATSSKKVYRVNEGSSTSVSCRSAITKPLATNSDVCASFSTQSRKKSRPSINADPPRGLSVRLDIEKYFSDKEWARKTQLERDQLRAQLEMYSLNRTFGKNPEPPSFVLAYKERKVRHLQKIREEKLSNVGKGLKFKKSSKPTNNAGDNNQQISTSIIENNSQNIQAEKSVKPAKRPNDIKQRKSKEEAQVHGRMTVSQIDDVLKKIRDSTIEPSPIEKLKMNGEILKIFQYKSFEGSVLKKKFNPKTVGRPIQINGAKSPKIVQILLKRIVTDKKSGLNRRLQNKSNSDMPIIKFDEDCSFSEIPAGLEISNNEPTTSKHDPASQRELDNTSYFETSRKNLEVSNDSSVFKIPVVPKKSTSSISRQVKIAEKDKLMQLAANGAVTANNNKLRKKLIREQRAKLREERRKKYEGEIARRTSREYIWNDFFNEVSSLTLEETDELCFTAAEQKLSLIVYHSWKNEVLAPMASDLLDKGKSKIEVVDEKKKKRKECGEKKEKSNVKTSGNALSADATGSDVSGYAVSGSTCQVQKKDESVGKKRRYPKRSVPVKNYTEPENINMDDFVFCDVCGREWLKQCNVHGKMMTIPDIPVNRKKAGYNYAKETTPRILGVAQSKIVNAGKGVWTRDMIKNQIQFGPYQGRTGKGNPKDPNYAWQLREMAGGLNYIDASDERYSNWMRYVNCARNINEMNLMAYQFEGGIYYRTFRLVAPHEELFVFYGEQFGSSLGIDVKNFRNPTLTNEKDVSFYCAECNSVFTSPLYLEQHEMTCLLGLTPSKKPKLLHATQTMTTVASTDNTQSKNVLTSSNQTSNSMMSVSNVQEPLSLTDGTSTEQHLSLNVSSTHVTKNEQLLEVSGEEGVKCHLCNKIYSTIYHLNIHIKSKHESVRPFKCSDCDKAFSSKSILDKHFQSVHLKVCLFKCNMCDYKCSKSSNLKQHMDAVHLNIRKFECNMCDYKCSKSCHLKQHMDAVHLNIRKFECNMCDYKCSKSSNLKQHMDAVHLNIRKFECNMCDYKCSKSCHLRQHMDAVHLNICKFECNMCDYKCSKSCHLKQHMDAVHLNIRKFECNMCDYKCSQSGSLKQHMDAVHLNIRKFECNMCDYKCSQNGLLKRHMDAVHLNIRKFECNMCDYKFSEKGNLKKHIDAVHLNVRKFECNMCDYKCSHSGHLKKHMDAVHLNIRKFECNMCDYKCSKSCHLKQHMDAVHLNIRKFECNMCDYKCSKSCHLKQHMDAVHLNIRKFECNMCDYKCSQSGLLKRHMDAVHLNIRKFECNMCDYKFSEKGNLKKHIDAVHLNVRKFECNMCDYKCSHSGHLKQHMDAVHLNIRKFECNMCDYKCSQSGSLKQHMDAVHLNIRKF